MLKKGSSRRKLTRREQRDLDIEINFIEGVVQRDPHFVEALQILGDDYTRRGKFDEGLRIDEQLSRLRPRDPMALYNLACITPRVALLAAVSNRRVLGTMGRWNRANSPWVKAAIAFAVVAMSLALMITL